MTDWYKIDEQNKAIVHVDADQYMEAAMADLEALSTDLPIHVKLEVARQWRHWDLQVALRHDGHWLPGKTMEVRVHGNKSRWNVALNAPEEARAMVTGSGFSRAISPVARDLFKAARGFALA